ncbi:MAG: uroporphyrinogen decarboxylase family protein [Fimbriimonas sp.]|nr:uroporphyrinogen decarboxylase family protein [Fimbriimonas sp.]
MGYQDGWSAIHMEMPGVVPRTEYSAEFHWPLIESVTGISGLESGDSTTRSKASREFVEAWDYAFMWSTLIGADDFGSIRTRMGHAVYMSGAEDWDENRSQAFATPDEVLAFRPLESLPAVDRQAARIRFEQHYESNRASLPSLVNMTGVYVTCVSGLIDLFGWQLLLEAHGDDPVRMGDLTNEYCRWLEPYFEALAESNVQVVMVHDDCVWSSGAIFHPDWYRRYVFPNYRRLIEPLRAAGKRILFTADGDYTMFVDDIADCGVSGFVMEPWTDMQLVAERYGKTHVIVGNADTRILLSGSMDAIEREVARCMSIGKSCPGFVLAVGNHIPPNTPVENALHYDACYRSMRNR